MHLDVNVPETRRQVQRLLGLGASFVREGADYTVMRDPEGNEFCVVQR